jgi:hypothetical protein
MPVDVNVPLGDQFLHPPIGILRPHLDYFGPYSGNETLTEWSSTPGPVFTHVAVSNTFGVLVQLNGIIPAGYGLTLGWNSSDGLYTADEYEIRLCQLVVQHQFLSGAWTTTQVVDVRSFPTTVLWSVALPGRIGILAAPGLAFDLFYLQVN